MTDDSHKSDFPFIFLCLCPFIALGILNGIYNPYLFAASELTFWLLDAFHNLILPLTILFILYKRIKLLPQDYGLAGPSKTYPAWEMIGAGIFSAVLLLLVYLGFWYFGGLVFGFNDFEFSFVLVVPEGRWHLPTVLYLAITAGFVEEVIYRGLIWNAFSQMKFSKFKKPMYVFLSSAVFAAVHWEQGLAGIVSSFAFGFVAAMLYLNFKNLWPIITAHTLIDVYSFW